MTETIAEAAPIEAAPKPARKVATKKAAKPKPKAKPKARKNTWTPALKTKLRAAIKGKTQTYASIAKKLGVTPQTVWASLKR